MRTLLHWFAILSVVMAGIAPVFGQDTESALESSSPLETSMETSEDTSALDVPVESDEGLQPESEMPASTPNETMRTEVSVEELERLINAPEDARLGREVDEPDQPYALFSDEKRIQELLGKDPRYVYVPSGSDPMIVPWVRNRVMAEELVAEANELMGTGKYEEALSKVKTVLERFSDTESEAVQQARRLREQLQRLVEQQRIAGETNLVEIPTGPRPTLPLWIPENTRGILFDEVNPENSTVLIGDYPVKVGDSIPSYPGIKVAEIKKGLVTLDYQGEKFRLIVEGGGNY